MSNTDAANALLTAINFDRFAEIEARHAPDVLFTSFRGPILNSSVAVADWHRVFLRDYADCNYTEIETIEQGETVCVRATIEAKGYDWRHFTQRVVEVLHYGAGEVRERRLYGMLRDVTFDKNKPVNAAMENARGYRGGSASATKKAVEAAYAALLAGDSETARASFIDKCALIDGVYGLAAGFDDITGLIASVPRPAFGIERVTAIYAGEHDALVEIAVDPSRPRAAHWVRLVDGKIAVIEAYWMLREIGIRPDVNYDQDRHQRRAILPI